MSKNLEFYGIEPSPFTMSNHQLLAEARIDESAKKLLSRRPDHVWEDSLAVNPDLTNASPQSAPAPSSGPSGLSQHQPSEPAQSEQTQSLQDVLSNWEFCNPGRIVKKKRRSNRDKSKERVRFTSRVPFHKKPDVVDAIEVYERERAAENRHEEHLSLWLRFSLGFQK